MKLRNKLAAITAAAMLAFTGVGFAAWTFANEKSANVGGDNVVTCAVETKNLVIDEGYTKLYLIFDAPAAGTTGSLKAGEGIFFATDKEPDAETGLYTKVTSLTLTGSFEHTDNDAHYNHAVSYTFDCTPTNTLSATYVTQTAAGSFDANVTGATSTFTDVSTVYTLPTFDYTAAVKAYNHASEMSAMITSLNDSEVSFAFTFNID